MSISVDIQALQAGILQFSGHTLGRIYHACREKRRMNVCLFGARLLVLGYSYVVFHEVLNNLPLFSLIFPSMSMINSSTKFCFSIGNKFFSV